MILCRSFRSNEKMLSNVSLSYDTYFHMRFRAIHFQGCQDKGSEKTFTTFDRPISFQMLNQILIFKMNTPTVITVALK